MSTKAVQASTSSNGSALVVPSADSALVRGTDVADNSLCGKAAEQADKTAAHLLNLRLLLDKLPGYLEADEIEKVKEAYYYAEKAHAGQYRRTKDPYITHPLAVADILADMHMDYQTLMAGLLHDVIEDTDNSKYTLRENFEPEVAELVDGVSKLTTIFTSQAEAQAKNLQKMAVAVAKDIRVILVKFADRLHNMRTLYAMPIEKRRRIARETLEFYAPIAGRLGMNDIRIQFEELGFQSLYPMRYKHIKQAIAKVRGKHQDALEKIRSSIATALDNDGIEAVVTGREKHFYSVYDKMKQQRKSFKELTDVLAFRIIVDKVDTCYRTLGVIHNLYKPVAGRFKDYIAIPRANGYQSLHTCLFGQSGMPVEIQIRTALMDDVATNGIASHWLYKSKEQSSPAAQAKVREWMYGILELGNRTGDSMEFVEHLKTDLLQNEIYVFSSDGNILELPAGASPIDFAYALDTQTGNSCAACRIDRHLAPLSTPLSSGQTIEIITTKNGTPRAEWLSFVVTGKARASIHYALQHLRRSDSILFGKEMLESSIQKLGLSLESIPETAMASALRELGVAGFDELYYQLGVGDSMPYLTVRTLLKHADIKGIQEDDILSLQHAGPVTIRGTEGVVVTYADCCHPIPGDAVIGHIQKGFGIDVHIETCGRVAALRKGPHQIYPVQWADEPDGNFEAVLDVDTTHQKSAVAELVNASTTADVTVMSIAVKEQDERLASIRITLTVRNRTHLATVIRKLRSIKDVVHINRPR